jgi:hypothetical protein
MANQGAKKIVEKNKQRMELLWRIILVSNVSAPLGFPFRPLRSVNYLGRS